MHTPQENLQAAGDYARYKMLETKITGIGILALMVLGYWFFAH